MTVVVTGAGGFVGSHIALTLAERGLDVVGTVRTPAKAAFLEPRVRLAKADITDRASLVAAFAGADAIVSNAALGSNQGELADMERVNCEGVRNVLEAAHEAGVRRVVHISSVAVYRTRLFVAIDEDAQRTDTTRHRFQWSDLTTDWRYARTKTMSEQIAWEVAAERGLALTCLRPGPVYGSRDTKATAKLVRGMKRRVRLAPTVGVPWVHAGDVAAMAAAALEREISVGRAYNVAGPPVSQLRFLRTMRKILGDLGWRRRALLVPLPVPVFVRFDTTRAERELGFVARPIEDGLREALAEYRLG
ncbi:MAG: NAD-dependent epimerase/dehydratase family protein [Deltaproteobacteria bacterium]|nr:NAD-dependent epimerase/dehydratase family protein [Deltaproteobacteria bacterium]